MQERRANASSPAGEAARHSDAAALVVWDLDGPGGPSTSAAAAATVHQGIGSSQALSPRVIVRLFRPHHSQQPSSGSRRNPSTSCIELRLPLKQASVEGRPGREDRGLVQRDAVWLRASCVSCNDSAKAAWRVLEAMELGPYLSQLAAADPTFLDTLELVAMSVAAPQSMRPLQPTHSALYRPRHHASLVPGEWAGMGGMGRMGAR